MIRIKYDVYKISHVSESYSVANINTYIERL